MIEPLVQLGDLEIIKQKLDYFAFNHYTRSRVHHDPDHPFEAGALPPPPGTPVTDMGWEIAPDAFRQVMVEAKERYAGDLPIYILENGAACPDQIDADGHIRDERPGDGRGDPILDRDHEGAWLADLGYSDMPVHEHPHKERVRAKANHYVPGRDGGRPAFRAGHR